MADYPVRSDLRNTATAATGQTYGKATEQLNAQRAVPMAPSPMTAPTGAPQQAGPIPGSLTPLFSPTQRPLEPITAGANFGAGPTALQAGIPIRSETQSAIDEVRAIAQMHPSSELMNLLDKYGDQ